jgi:hypothetical protein
VTRCAHIAAVVAILVEDMGSANNRYLSEWCLGYDASERDVDTADHVLERAVSFAKRHP